MKLKHKLAVHSSIIIVLAMALTCAIVAFTVTRQNTENSFQALQKSFGVILNELTTLQVKMEEDTQKLILASDIGTNVKFIGEFADNYEMTRNTYDTLVRDIYSAVISNDLWQIGIFDKDAKLTALARLEKDRIDLVSPAVVDGKPVWQAATLKSGEKLNDESWKISENMPLEAVTPLGKIPEETINRFDEVQGALCMVSMVPATAMVFVEGNDEPVSKPVGFVAAYRKIDRSFVQRMQTYTGTAINVFASKGLCAGTLEAMDALDPETIRRFPDKLQIDARTVHVDDLVLGENRFKTAVLPLESNGRHVGAIASLYSLDLGWSRTVKLVQLIALAALGCTLAALPFTIFLANSISRSIKRITDELRHSAHEISSGSEKTLSASRLVAQGSSDQAAAIEQSSASLEEMSAMTKENARGARQADQLMKESIRVIREAEQSMQQLTSSVEAISTQSEEVAKIIKTIDEIAFQTNLLALNAAVEAARAGEAGAGFAVVSDEVRNLAIRAAEAASNTAGLIEGTVRRIGDSSTFVEQTNQAFSKVNHSAGKVANLVNEITAASEEQAQGIEQINTAVSNMDEVTRQNADNAEQSSDLATAMNAQSDQIESLVARLMAIITGNRQADKKLSPSHGAIPEPASPSGKIPLPG